MRTGWLIIACSLLSGLATDVQSFDADTPIVEMGDQFVLDQYTIADLERILAKDLLNLKEAVR